MADTTTDDKKVISLSNLRAYNKALNTAIEAVYAKKTDLKDYTTTADISTTYVTKTELSTAQNTAESTYAKKTDLDSYATTEALTAAQNTAESTYATKDELDAAEVDTTVFMTKANPTGTGSFSLNRKADTTVGRQSVAEGVDTTSSGYGSHAEGVYTVATGLADHAEGDSTKATGYMSHAEGNYSNASESCSHAEGYQTTSSGPNSHAEGYKATASGYGSHAEGHETQSSGNYSHTEGENTSASGEASHAGGYFTTAGSDYQATIGKYNRNTSDDIFEIGNGNGETTANAFAVTSDGYCRFHNSDDKIYLSVEDSVPCLHYYDTTSSTDITYKLVKTDDTSSYVTTTDLSAYALKTDIKCKAITSTNNAYVENSRVVNGGGDYCHAEGYMTFINFSTNYSHVEGSHTMITMATESGVHVQGRYNRSLTDDIFEIGNGTPSSSGEENDGFQDGTRSNAFAVTRDGYCRYHNSDTKIYFSVESGVPYLHYYDDTNKKDVALKLQVVS